MEKKKIIFGVLMFSLLLLLLFSSSLAYAELTPPLPCAPNYISIDVEEAHQMLAENPEQIILLDVRTEEEYNAEYIPVAINIPLSDLENRLDELDKSKTIIVYCQSGGRSRTASDMLAKHGFASVYNMLSGINAWKEKFATSIATPMPTQTPTLSPIVTPSPAASPFPITTPTLTPEEEKRVQGFEAPLAILVLLILFVLLRRKYLLM